MACERPYPGFPHMDERIIEFNREYYQGVRETAAKVPELAQAYLKGLDGAV
jgi:hypothetical protein